MRATMDVTVAFVAAGIEELVPVTVDARATVRRAVEQSGLGAVYGLELSDVVVAIHGGRTTLDAPLRPGDDGAKFRQAFEGIILPQLKKFAPELLVISAGFTCETEPVRSRLRTVP